MIAQGQRCVQAGLDPEGFEYRFIDAAALAEKLEANRVPVETAAEIMQGLLAYTPGGTST